MMCGAPWSARLSEIRGFGWGVQMRSSTGEYYESLDHIRAFAIFLVFTWHFIHAGNLHVAPPPVFPFSVVAEGHTGVSLFMALSGYLFAKILYGKKINFPSFVCNRVLRLFPLLLFVILVVGADRLVSGDDILVYFATILEGAVMPTLPNGGWSITVEIHFYLLLPLILFFSEKSLCYVVALLLMMILFRFLFHFFNGHVQGLSYWTIVGRIDQFLCGILFFNLRKYFLKQGGAVFLLSICFLFFYWWFDAVGGYYRSPSYPSPNRIWIVMPTIEGAFYSILIAWYDVSYKGSRTCIGGWVAGIGRVSYSIYLLHFFFVFRIAGFLHENVVSLAGR